tara:strand:+ start:2053 stop:2604 length:552 start_codon:yes stop_codon:yes gene_type:complete
MKKIALIFSISVLFFACGNKVTPKKVDSDDKKKTFLSKYNQTTWTNGFSTYTFDTSYSQKVDVVLPICDTCLLPTLECHMCGYTWMRDEIGKFSFGKKYQNDFFYEEDETQFYEDNDSKIYANYIRGGFSETYESGNIIWVPSNTDSLVLQTVRMKNKPLLEAFQQKKKEENEKVEQHFFDDY